MRSHLTYIVCFSLFLLTIFVSSCTEKQEDDYVLHLPPAVEFDLDSIKARGKLIVLTENGPSTYYQYRGQSKGFDYDMVKAYAKYLGVKLEIKLLDDVNKMFELLNKGEGDIIASNLTYLKKREEYVGFTQPLYTTRPILVQRKFDISKPDSLFKMISDTTQLSDHEIWVHKYSSFRFRLKELEKNNDIKIDIKNAPGEIGSEDMLRLTSEGQLPATVTDENMAVMLRYDYPDLDMTVPIGPEEKICWAVRKNSSALLENLNDWLSQEATQKKLTKTHDRYFQEKSLYEYKGPYALPVLSANQISPFDSIFKKYAPEIGWDWKLLAAISYQESRFNPKAESWSGAFGVMQLMPETAARFGCDTSQRVTENIHAATKYLNHLENFWKKRIDDPIERKKFILASYNIGPGHILDAQTIANHLGKKDSIWDKNVAECLLLKTQEKYYTMEGVKHGYCRAQEPFNFVSKILAVYDHYKKHPIK